MWLISALSFWFPNTYQFLHFTLHLQLLLQPNFFPAKLELGHSFTYKCMRSVVSFAHSRLSKANRYVHLSLINFIAPEQPINDRPSSVIGIISVLTRPLLFSMYLLKTKRHQQFKQVQTFRPLFFLPCTELIMKWNFVLRKTPVRGTF